MRNKTKKILVSIVLGVYLLTNFFQSVLYRGNTVYAAGPSEDMLDYTNIVAIIVNDRIYNSIKTDVEWYAKTYIQGAGNNKYTSISNSKALVFPINVDNFSAKNITQLLENIYFDGISGVPSKLVGVVLIGDIPLPVVNQDGYIYPTIYPYVDFEEQKFIWDEDSKYFVYNDNPNGQAEIWHGMINFEENISEYNAYFNKLKSYLNNPSKYIGKALWYEDFIGNNKYFNDSSLNFYLNNFIFAEDLGYHRYSDLMVKVMQGQRNKEMGELIESLNEVNSGADYTGMDALSAMTDEMSTPTMQIKTMLDNGYLSKYSSLFGQKYLKTITNNVETANRWIESRTGSDGTPYYLDAFDTVYKKAEINDEVTLRSDSGIEPFIIMLNNALEEAVDKKVEQEKYRLNEVIPLTYLKYEGRKRFFGKCVWETYDAFENYFFGISSRFIQSMEDTTTYRGTFRNYSAIDGLKIQNIQNSNNPSTDLSGLDLNKKSIGGSYDIFAIQVDANRGYNYNNSLKEYEMFSGNKVSKMELWDVNCVNKFLGICWRRRWSAESHTNGSGCDLSEGGDQGGCEDPFEYAIRIWGGASPLNLTGAGGGNFGWISGYTYTGATSPVFDIAGSSALDINKPEYESNSFESVKKYSSLLLRKFSPETDKPKFKSANPAKKAPDSYGFGYDYSMDYDVKFTNKIPNFGNGNHVVGWLNTGVLTANQVDYFENYRNNAHIEGNGTGGIVKIVKSSPGECQGEGEIYTYKTLDSRVKNDSVNEDELNGYTYEIFNDDRSNVKQLYQQITDLIEIVSGTVNAIVGSDDGSLRSDLELIKDTVERVNDGFDEIINFDLDSLSNYTTGQVNGLANNRRRVFDSNTVDELTGTITRAQNAVLNLSGLVGMGDSLFSGVIDFIEDEKEKFSVNGWDIIFLNSWKNKIHNDMRIILDNFSNIKLVVAEAGALYHQIGDIGTNYIGGIAPISMDIVNELSGMVENLRSTLGGSGCETKYRTLCNTLNTLINDYTSYVDYLNAEKDGINNVKNCEYDDLGNITDDCTTIREIFLKLEGSLLFQHISDGSMAYDIYRDYIQPIPGTGNEHMLGFKEGMNMTTSDRPIDSPRYLTFKGVGGDKVTFIYPDLYKAEIFSGNSDNGLLTLKTPVEIKAAIQKFLKDTVNKYNEYLLDELGHRNQYYQQNANAFDTLNDLNPLASPNHFRDEVRPYALFDENYLINWLETSIQNSPFFSGEELAKSDPIGFIANMIYYQNITWQVKTLSGTIQGDFDNQRIDYDVNEKVSYLMDNYLIKDNNKGNFLTPDYRDNGYEVAFINSNGNDRILYENTPDFVDSIQSASKSYETPSNTNPNASPYEQELISECNIPEDGGVPLFQLSGGSFDTPWIDAFVCRFRKTIEKPLNFKITFPFTWDSEATGFWDNLGDIFSAENLENIFRIDDYKAISNTYLQQMKLLDTDDINNTLLENMDLSNPGDAAKLWDILSFTIIKEKKATTSADNPYNEIKISSSNSELGNIDFHIINVGATKVKLLDGDNILSNNITIGTGGFSTGKITFNPYNERSLSLQFQNPVDGLNVILVFMCLPGTQNISNCVKSSVGINIVPGEVKHVYIDLDRDLVLEGASVPFKVRGTDMFENNVGELISQKFVAFSSSGNLTLNGVTSETIMFSNFDKTNFSLNATGGDLDGKTISIQVSGSIDGIPGVKATESVNVIKGRLDTYSGNNRLSSGSDIINELIINLPDKDIYFVNGQPNINKIPKISLKLVDKNGNTINIDGKISAKVKNNLVTLGNITGNSVSGYKFSKTNTFYLSGGLGTIYLSPSFSAGEEILYLSMPGIDDIQLPINIKHASPKIVSLSAEKTVLDMESSTNATVKVFDNRENIIDDEDIFVRLGTANDKISLSQSGNIRLSGGSYNFNVYSHNKGGLGYIYATIHTGRVPIDQQKPDTLPITIQEKMLPESGLNVMYLNLFGSDRGNQWGYMSNNEKYSESLIKNSEKLITVTTQLVDYENIKYYPVIIDNKLQINNIIGNKINLILASGLLFDISSIGTISATLNSFELEMANISEDAIQEYISTQMSNSDRGKNVIFYMPEQTDSIIQENEVVNSAIYLNDEKVFDIYDFTFDRNLTITLSEDTIAGYQVWQVFFGGILAGKIVIAVDNENGITTNLISTSENYGISQVWINGTSDEYGIGFYGLESSLPNSTFGYKSIQDSYDPMLGIGFTADFKNITNFGGGMTVGESTIPFSSELLINIGDPLLKRVNSNETSKIYDENGDIKEDTDFDLGIGEVIYSEPGKEIHKVINIDFNNDGLEDIIVIFKDGTVKILKNYGGTNPFQNLGALTILADRITDVSVGDVDGNGYKDLIIWTASGWLRVYKNNGGIFDVDGYPVCINVNVDRGGISDNPEKISGLHQIFLEDMNLDGAIDIVTNDDLGFIKIFYGGTTSGNVNYLSTSKYLCDENWYNRVEPNSKTVYQFGIKIDNNSHILDQSLVHRQGISNTESGEVSAEDLGIDGGMFEGNIDMDNMGDVLNNLLNFDVSAAETLYMQSERFKQAGFGIIPVYESGVDNEEDIDYIEIGALTGSDPIKVYKTYEDLNNNPIDGNIIDNTGSLVRGDLVRVSVYIVANNNFTGTFIDNIVGPWQIPLSEYYNDTFENFWFDSEYIDRGYITSGQIDDMVNNIHRDLENARYMIDNIKMKRGDRLKFSYGLIYNGYNSFDIDVSPLSGDNFSGVVLPYENLAIYSHDNYPDISTQPTDGCNDSMFVFFNNGSDDRKNYDKKFMDLARLMEKYNTQSQANGDGARDSFTTGIGNAAEGGDAQEIMNQVGSFAKIMESINWKGILKDWGGVLQNQGLIENFSYLGDTINMGSEIIDGLTNDTVKKIDEAIGGVCNGVDLSTLGLGGDGGCGLPVPFNQAFLGVGKYHLFGCYNLTFLDELIGDGWPVMTFPGNRGPVYGVYLPFPGIFGYPFKGAGSDGFVDFVPTATNPSMFRLYLMPTLTLDLGIALCFGPYATAKLIVDPLGSIAGNCVVFSVPLPCPNANGSNDQGANATTEIPYEYTLLKGCNKQNNPIYLGNDESPTPFVFGGSSPHSNSFQPIIPDGSYAGGLINIEIKPESSSYYRENNPIDIDAIILEGGATVQNKIRGSKEQGLIDKIVKQWLDKQIKYIMNNLTNFKISIAWPDFAGLIGKMPVVNNVKNDITTNDDKKEKCENNKGRWVEDGASSYCEDTPASLQLKCENRGLKWNASNQTCTASDSALSSLDARGQENLISRDQISSRSDYTNPFEKLAEAFSETPLINISTQDITVNVPLLTSEDITSYVSMSQSWVNEQSEIIEKRKDFFKGLISYCSNGSININGIEDLGNAINQLKEQYEDASYYAEGENDNVLEDIQGKINALEKLETKYNLNDLGDYKVYEAKDGGFYVYTKYSDITQITPYDVYLYFNPGTSSLSMFTSGFDLNINNANSGKSKISINRNGDKISNEGLMIKKSTQNISHSCASLFMDGTIDGYVNGFLNIQSNADSLIFSVKENIETLQQYKLFPLELYERIHVVERYIGDISNLINSILGTLSVWMETNANRFSQYVDAIITLMTVLETYQLIIDFSADWSESCSTCTNDNYDQFSCKLGKICDMLGIELPIIEIPPTKIPSIYLDFSEIHAETDVKLPSFTFNAIAVPLPELPNLPEPPSIDFSLNLDDSIGFGINVIEQLKGIDLSLLSSINLGSIPLIPSPPTLPDLPSFVPSIEMELPLLPPAPKIPELPNTIENSIKAAKIVGKILCIVKLKFGLVAETSIKAKVEQITQRDYEIPFRDNFDLTLSDWNATASAKLPGALSNIFTGVAALLQTNEFKDTKLKGFDLSLKTYIDLHLNFDDFYAFVESVVGKINDVSYNITDFVSSTTDFVSGISKDRQDRLQACVSNPISEACNPNVAVINEYNTLLQDVERYKSILDNSFKGLGESLGILESKKDDLQDLQVATNELTTQLRENQELLSTYTLQLSQTSDETDRTILADKIRYTNRTIEKLQSQIDVNNEKMNNLRTEISELNGKYGSSMEKYNEVKRVFGNLSERLSSLKEELTEQGNQIIDQINEEIRAAGENVDYSSIQQTNLNLLSGQQEIDSKKEKDKQRRSENLQDMYKELDGPISYVDYDPVVNENNFKVLQNTLTKIKDQTNNKDIKNRAQEYLSLISMNRKIEANVDSINNVEKEYTTVVGNYKSNNEEIADLIQNDYDTFLAAVSSNDSTLVANKSFNITLSTKLFDMDRNAINVLSDQEDVMKKYMDYNMNNLQGYINALENNSPETLNMDEKTYNLNKSYLKKIKDVSDEAYAIITKNTTSTETTENKNDTEQVLLAQSAGGNGGGSNNTSSSTSTVDIANYIDGYTLNTEEGTYLLANRDYINKFQSRLLLTDINKDGHSDLILWDEHNIYIKYRKGYTSYDNASYRDASNYYLYRIDSYDDLLSASENGFVNIGGLYIKLVDSNREVKNFKYVGQTFDTIKVSWLNSYYFGDNVDGYLVKLIHRVDQFNDKEPLLHQGNNEELFDKKYILVLPKGSEFTGTNIELEEGITGSVEQLIGTGNTIFSLSFYNQTDDTISLIITDVPRNWQYSEVYTLDFINNTYMLSSSSSNQVVAGPQIIADDKGPDPVIKLYRPATDRVVSEGISLEGYVGTNYILQVDWEDNVAMDRIWIANELGETLVSLEDIGNKTGYIEYSGLYFTGTQNISYYIGGADINGNEYVVNTNLLIKTPSIEIINILKGNQNLSYNNGNIGYSFGANNIGNSISNSITSFREVPSTNNTSSSNSNNSSEAESLVTIVAQLDQDIDSGYVQFFRNRTNDKRERLTGNVSSYNITSFKVEPEITEIYGGYFDIGNDIGLYSADGSMVATINPGNGKITKLKNTIDIKLDYSSQRPIIKILEGNTTIFWIIYSSIELVSLNLVSSDVSVQPLDNELFGDFYGGQAVIKNGEVILYVSPIGQIYTDATIYGDYDFDSATNSVVYSFKASPNGNNLGNVKVKIKNLLEY